MACRHFRLLALSHVLVLVQLAAAVWGGWVQTHFCCIALPPSLWGESPFSQFCTHTLFPVQHGGFLWSVHAFVWSAHTLSFSRSLSLLGVAWPLFHLLSMIHSFLFYLFIVYSAACLQQAGFENFYCLLASTWNTWVYYHHCTHLH